MKKKVATPKKTARNDWGLLHLRASMLYHNYVDYAPVRSKRFWDQYLKYKRARDIKNAFLVTGAFKISFTRT